ncbi:TetR family transcriptional regulator [Sphingomonas sp. DBB INV C78]|uniref:TetR/AcrR family transcriptional regulator n=1 Tax=Sphingomonas sp. DBB INV C78 TaxID=3349434 RepID=UPI0036D399DA
MTVPQTQILSKRERNRLNIRGAILKAARIRFQQDGIQDARMDEIADEAAVSRATLYNYFPSKADIIDALVERMGDDFVALILRHTQEAGSTADRIVATFTESARILEAEADVARLLVEISWQSWGSEGGNSGLARLIDAFIVLLGGKDGADDIRKDVDIRLMAEMLISVYTGVIRSWQQSTNYPLQKQLAAAARLMGETFARN